MESIYTGRTNIKRHARRVIGRNRDMRLQLINRYHLNICYKNIYIYLYIWFGLTKQEPVRVTQNAKMHKWSWSLINIIIYRG